MVHCSKVQLERLFKMVREGLMKRVTLVCKTCGNEERIEIATRDDLEKRPRPTRPASCSKCGSERVELHD
jgi:hypothetical protein